MPRNQRATLFNDTATKGHHGCTLVNRQLRAIAREAGIDITRALPLAKPSQKIDPDEADLILVNGEGTLHHDTKGARAIGRIAAHASQTGQPAFLINSICQALPSSVGEALRGFRGVYARDRYSQASFAEHGVDAGYAPDLTLTYTPPSRGRTADRLVVTDSSMVAETAALFRLTARLPDARFLPLRARPPGAADARDRRTIRYSMKIRSARLHPDPVYRARYRNIVEEFDDFIALLQEQAGFLLAGRFHAICIAFDLEIPFFAVPANSWKVEALLEEAGLSHRLLRNVEQFPAKAAAVPPSAIAPFTDEELERIAGFKAMAREKNRAMFKEIAASIGRP